VVGVVFMNKNRQRQCQGHPQLISEHILKQNAIQVMHFRILIGLIITNVEANYLSLYRAKLQDGQMAFHCK
jgi:hypothetical protein